MKKFKTLLLLAFYILWSISLNINPQITSGVNTPWTREKAEHLARATLFNVDSSLIDTLTNA